MTCEHKRLKSVNCVIFRADCGARLEKPPEPEKKPVRKTAKKAKAD